MQAKTSSRDAEVCGAGRRRKATSPESTFGTGQKTDRGTRPCWVTSAYQAALTLGTPYVRLPGGAASRSATSHCTITSPWSSDGSCGQEVEQHRYCHVVGEVGDEGGRCDDRQLGQLGKRVIGGDHRQPVARRRHVVGDGARQGGGQHGVDLHGNHPRPGLQQPEGERPQTGTDLQHRLLRPVDVGKPDDPAHGVGVDDEVLPPALGRPDVEVGSELSDASRRRGVARRRRGSSRGPVCRQENSRGPQTGHCPAPDRS